MTVSTESSPDPNPRGGTQRYRALSEIQYNSIIAGDQATSSEDETPKEQVEIPANDARGAIGVSIGREQTRLNSPTTPAAEKAAALDAAGGFFGDGFDDSHVASHDPINEQTQSLPLPTSDSDELTPFPTPTQTPPTEAHPSQRSSQTRATLRDGFLGSRRSSSGSDAGTRGQQKGGFLAGLPSLPRRLSIRNPFSHSSEALKESPEAVAERVKNFTSLPVVSDEDASQSQHSSSHRRAASDDSLVLQRPSSRISFGDDSRFEDVHEQINSRMKAIKDSYKDANFRVRIPSLSVSNLAPDFLRDHLPGHRDHLRNGNDVATGEAFDPEDSVSQSAKPVDPYTRSPYHSAKAILSDAPPHKSSMNHPNFTRALEQLEGDIVILGGYRGSILRSAEPPHRQLWVPIKVGLNLRKVDLEVGLDEDADERATDTIIPGGMLTHIGPVDIARRLFKRLRSSENARNGTLRVHDYGYDWRLHPTHLSNQLVQFLSNLPSNRPGIPHAKRGALVIAHSLGGLITRHAVNQRPELFSGVLYAGVPRTCVNILGPLRNGDEVLLSSRVLTAQVNFTIRTSFALLPLNGRCFFNKDTKEEYPVDFFDPQTWIDYRLSPCIARPLPPFSPPPTKPTGLISEYVNTLTSALPSLPLPHRKSISKPSLDSSKLPIAPGNPATEPAAMNRPSSPPAPQDESISTRTAVSLPREQSLEYLTRTLASVKRFKQALAFHAPHQSANLYPPAAVLYGKSVPTVFGAKVASRDAIQHADAYDNLAFASGDGVVLARAAMLPEGYQVVPHGVVSSERGHITLLGDLDAVGRCLCAVLDARREGGVGLGLEEEEEEEWRKEV